MTALTDHRTAVHSTYPDEPEMTFPAERTPPADESARPGEPGRADERPGARVVAVTGDHHAADTGELNLLDRQARRRVAGLSPGLAGVPEVEDRAFRLGGVVLVGV